MVGCGLMGGGIAQVCAQSGYAVLVSEINEELLRRGLAGITASLDRAVRKERIGAADRDAAVARIIGTTDTGDFADRDLVIEAVIEDLDIKKRIFGELDKACPEIPCWPPIPPACPSRRWRGPRGGRIKCWGCTSSTRCRP